jgi:signal transduction histidine kinase
VSFVDADRQWFKARIGLDDREMDRCVAFCGHTILDDDVLEIRDARLDPRFAKNPLVTGPPGIRYYAGAPIVTREGLKLGSLCLIDTVPRKPLSPQEKHDLRSLAALIVDQLELRVSLKERADFFASLTHEIRRPLNAALGYVEVIHSGMFGEIRPKRYAEYVDHIHKSCNHVVEVISEFLDFFKHEAGFLVLNETEFEFDALRADCVGMVEAMVASSGLTLEAAPVLEGLRIKADRQRLLQILLNLLVNAAKFTPPGGRISLNAGIHAKGGFWFSVSDTGSGMGPNEIAKALTPFGQVNGAANDSVAGTGLGLPFAVRLAELHGGSLDVASTPGRGTTMTVEMPSDRIVAVDSGAPAPLMRAGRGS